MKKQKLTSSLEDYLEAIYEISKNGEARAIDISKKLRISKPSVNAAVKTLVTKGFISHKPYGKIILSPKGAAAGAEILSRHSLLKDFFISILNMSQDTAEIDACKAEHALSEGSLTGIRSLTTFLKRAENKDLLRIIRSSIK